VVPVHASHKPRGREEIIEQVIDATLGLWSAEGPAGITLGAIAMRAGQLWARLPLPSTSPESAVTVGSIIHPLRMAAVRALSHPRTVAAGVSRDEVNRLVRQDMLRLLCVREREPEDRSEPVVRSSHGDETPDEAVRVDGEMRHESRRSDPV
jgi:hypothetical protein